MPNSILPFLVGSTWLAVDALRVTEVTSPLPFVAIPGASARAPGVVFWQGRAIAWVEVGAMVIGSCRPQSECPARTLVVHAGGCVVAMPADRVREVQSVGGYRLQPLQVAAVPYTSGEVELDGELVPVVDLDAVVEALIARAA